jgi:hypothetical protein
MAAFEEIMTGIRGIRVECEQLLIERESARRGLWLGDLPQKEVTGLGKQVL